jgi:hypothetical protein
MNTIIIEKECGCFKRSSYDNNQSFDIKDDALIQANLMVSDMNTKFCQKHDFILRENNDNFVISVDIKAKQSECCGGGHCS